MITLGSSTYNYSESSGRYLGTVWIYSSTENSPSDDDLTSVMYQMKTNYGENKYDLTFVLGGFDKSLTVVISPSKAPGRLNLFVAYRTLEEKLKAQNERPVSPNARAGLLG